MDTMIKPNLIVVETHSGVRILLAGSQVLARTFRDAPESAIDIFESVLSGLESVFGTAPDKVLVEPRLLGRQAVADFRQLSAEDMSKTNTSRLMQTTDTIVRAAFAQIDGRDPTPGE